MPPLRPPFALRFGHLPLGYILPGANTATPNVVLWKRIPAFFVNEISAVRESERPGLPPAGIGDAPVIERTRRRGLKCRSR
jgi:hypothetical protein